MFSTLRKLLHIIDVFCIENIRGTGRQVINHIYSLKMTHMSRFQAFKSEDGFTIGSVHYLSPFPRLNFGGHLTQPRSSANQQAHQFAKRLIIIIEPQSLSLPSQTRKSIVCLRTYIMAEATQDSVEASASQPYEYQPLPKDKFGISSSILGRNLRLLLAI